MEGAVLEMRGRLIQRPDEHGMTIRDTKKSHHSMGILYETTRKDDFHHSKEKVTHGHCRASSARSNYVAGQKR